MNIKQAKDYIENTVRLYLKKDEFGEYRIPVVRQRPIFLLGAPGIGKTAVMEQIAQELNVALVSYSMTHHTRQSALGLPFISHREYQGMKFDVSEYTMSEIIASVYEVMGIAACRRGFFFWMRSTVYRKHWPLPCSSFCSTRYLDATGYRTDG